MIRSRAQLIEVQKNGSAPALLFFWGHRPSVSGELTKSIFSQWWPAVFEKDAVRYASAEHFMMAEKARIFEDWAMLEKILLAESPAEAKAFGREVANFEPKKWEIRRFEAVVEGNVLKFSQDEKLKNFLLQTGEKVLVEASPRDQIWGIGLGENNPKAQNAATWRGQNLLGFALMETRERLRQV